MAITRLAIIGAMLFLPALTRADSVWQYLGNAVGTQNQGSEGFALTGTVLLNSNDQAIAWNFVAGPDIFNNFNSAGTINPFACTSCGSQAPFASWYILLGLVDPNGGPIHEGGYLYSTPNVDQASDHDGSAGQVYVVGNPGVWTEVVATPEPSSVFLLVAGLAALAMALSFKINLACHFLGSSQVK